MQKKWSLGLLVALALTALTLTWLYRQKKKAEFDAATPFDKGWLLIARSGCTDCHQGESSYRAPVLKGLIGRTVKLADGREVIADAAYVKRALLTPKLDISAGYQGIMPSYEGRLSEEEIALITIALAPPPAS